VLCATLGQVYASCQNMCSIELVLVPTRISLQLADRSVKYPVGQVEDLSVQVRKFYIMLTLL
jgi:hypothetical protein